MPSRWEIMEVLRRFGPMSTSEIADALGVWTDDISRALRTLEGIGKIKRVGKKPGKRKKMSIVWQLSDYVLYWLERNGFSSFYDIPYVQRKEEEYFQRFGRRFKRWD